MYRKGAYNTWAVLTKYIFRNKKVKPFPCHSTICASKDMTETRPSLRLVLRALTFLSTILAAASYYLTETTSFCCGMEEWLARQLGCGGEGCQHLNTVVGYGDDRLDDVPRKAKFLPGLSVCSRQEWWGKKKEGLLACCEMIDYTVCRNLYSGWHCTSSYPGVTINCTTTPPSVL